jgi:CBS domain containing-hemolysin-like protein
MTPRTVVFALPQGLTVAEVLSDHPDPPFSRIPVYDQDIDDVTGFVLKTDILLARLRDRGDATLEDLAREVRAVSQQASLEHVTDELLDQRVHILLALDAHGGLGGIVTLEDVVETLIGAEIVDEGDKTEDMRELARRKWRERIQRLGIDVSALDPALAPREAEDE